MKHIRAVVRATTIRPKGRIVLNGEQEVWCNESLLSAWFSRLQYSQFGPGHEPGDDFGDLETFPLRPLPPITFIRRLRLKYMGNISPTSVSA